VAVDTNLELTVDIKAPARGNSAYQTGLCDFEKKKLVGKDGQQIRIPRVVLEFKTEISTHDVLTYSAKTIKHRLVYPYLRYEIVASEETSVLGRLFTHNEAMDFCACMKGPGTEEFDAFLTKLLRDEIKASKCLEGIAFGAVDSRLFRTEIVLSWLLTTFLIAPL
jgi:hypothetical protein